MEGVLRIKLLKSSLILILPVILETKHARKKTGVMSMVCYLREKKRKILGFTKLHEFLMCC